MKINQILNMLLSLDVPGVTNEQVSTDFVSSIKHKFK